VRREPGRGGRQGVTLGLVLENAHACGVAEAHETALCESEGGTHSSHAVIFRGPPRPFAPLRWCQLGRKPGLTTAVNLIFISDVFFTAVATRTKPQLQQKKETILV
jgi:hypothetical protein